jgi:tetratricopeptide (TPR) repeat protein
MSRASVLNHLGITLVADSQFDAAIDVLHEALGAVAELDDNKEETRWLRASALGNLGGAEVLRGRTEEGILILEEVLAEMGEEYLIAEVCLDLCFAYVELEQYARAEAFGRRGMALATVGRQTRNANHLLGEICLRMQRYAESDAFFDVVASYYPEFKNVKQLLTAVDLCGVVNWKA